MEGVKQILDFEEHFFKITSDKSNALLNGAGDIVAKELATGLDFPDYITSDFGVLVSEIHALNRAKEFADKLILEIRQDFESLLKSRNFDDFINSFKDLVEVQEIKRLPAVAKDLIHMQTGLVISFGAVLKNCTGFDPKKYGDSFNRYFFSKEGYKTVAGDLIVRPKLPKKNGQPGPAAQGNPITAERYLRDMVRIIVETTGDGLYKTKGRYGKLKEKYGENEAQKKLVDWFDSFGDMAEASLLPVVEEVLNGAFGVELNPLIAASVGTFCSVSARKATEHSYLTLLGIE